MGNKKTILVVDDEKDLAGLIEKKLTQSGYQVSKAYNGREALEMLEGVHPDLIILDINMPVMGGIEFYNNISDEEGMHPSYLVLFLTVREELEHLFKCDLGAAGFVSKPFKLDHLLSEVERVLKQ